MPLFGYTISYLIAKLVRQRWLEARTIAVGTGIRNARKDFALSPKYVLLSAIAVVICQLSLEPPDGDIAIVIIVCCLIFTPVPLWLWLIGRIIAKKKFGGHYRSAKIL